MATAIKQLADVSDLYNFWAKEYDEDCTLIPAYAHLDITYNILLEKYAVQLSRNLTIELGCGTGIHSSILVKKNQNLVAVDISSECIRLAKRKMESMKMMRRINFIRCDAMHLPIKTNVASSVVSLGLLTCHTDGCGQILAEISRILSRNGCFVLDVQNKYSLNMIFYLLDALTGGLFFNLGFSSMKDFRKYLSDGKICWKYRDRKNRVRKRISFSTFSAREVNHMLSENSLVQYEMHGTHLLTLFMPLEYQEMRLPKIVRSILLGIGRFEKLLRNTLARFSSVIIVYGYQKK